MEGQLRGVDEAMSRVEGVTEGKGRRGRWRDNLGEWMRLCIGWKELNMKVFNISQDNYFMIIEFFFHIPKVNLLVMLKSSQVFPIGIV